MKIVCTTRAAAGDVTLLCLRYELAEGDDYNYPAPDVETLPIQITITDRLPAMLLADIRSAIEAIPDATMQP